MACYTCSVLCEGFTVYLCLNVTEVRKPFPFPNLQLNMGYVCFRASPVRVRHVVEELGMVVCMRIIAAVNTKVVLYVLRPSLSSTGSSQAVWGMAREEREETETRVRRRTVWAT